MEKIPKNLNSKTNSTTEKYSTEDQEKDYDEIMSSDLQYCGLVNQGSTCYLNSILQCLFMTPEFRFRILTWNYNKDLHGEKEDCILFQIQKLFAKMQLKFFSNEETKQLTKSFQWNSKDIYQQHDVQEFLRVLFSAIEEGCEANESQKIINEIYEGVLKNEAKCYECGGTSEKIEKFFDLSIPIRTQDQTCSSLESSFQLLLKPEKLVGDNQYFCERCKKKVDAIKTVSFLKLPKIMILHLLRFQYDPLLGSKKKIYDYFDFPEFLRMDEVIDNSLTLNFPLKKMSEASTIADEGIIEGNTENLNKNEYELFSVVLHSGTSIGGHFNVIIKSFEDNNWYNFNDDSVFKIKSRNLKNVIELENKTQVHYILMYRSKSERENYEFNDNLINEELKKIIRNDNDKRIKDSLHSNKDKFYDYSFKFKDVEKIIKAQFSEPIMNLKNRIIRDFKIGNESYLDKIRIKPKNPLFQNGLRTLEECQMYPTTKYVIELDVEDKMKLDENKINLHLNYFDNQSMLKSELLVDKSIAFIELENQIKSIFSIDDSQQIVVIIRKETRDNDYKAEYLICPNQNYNKNVNIQSLSDNNELCIYIEKYNELFESHFEKIWKIEVKEITASFNDPISEKELKKSDFNYNSYKFNHQIRINSCSSVGELKDKIKNFFNLGNTPFVIKADSHKGQEIRENSEILKNLFSKKVNLFIHFGIPLLQSEIRLNIFWCFYDLEKFELFPYKDKFVGEIKIDSSITVNELKLKIFEKFSEEIQLYCNINYCVLRNFNLCRPGKIFPSNEKLCDLGFQDEKKICIFEYFNELINPKIDDLQITFRELDTANMDLNLPIEFCYQKTFKNVDLLEFISLKLGIEIDNIEIHKIKSLNPILQSHLRNLKFISLNEYKNCLTSSEPLNLRNLDLLIIKDKSKVINETIDNKNLSFFNFENNNEKNSRDTTKIKSSLIKNKTWTMIDNLNNHYISRKKKPANLETDMIYNYNIEGNLVMKKPTKARTQENAIKISVKSRK